MASYYYGIVIEQSLGSRNVLAPERIGRQSVDTHAAGRGLGLVVDRWGDVQRARAFILTTPTRGTVGVEGRGHVPEPAEEDEVAVAVAALEVAHETLPPSRNPSPVLEGVGRCGAEWQINRAQQAPAPTHSHDP